MSWSDVVGHEAVKEQFQRRIAGGRLASTFLFVGPAGVGKRTFAMKLAQTLLCERVAAENMAPCQQCPSCHQVAGKSHPDLLLVEKPKGKNVIPIELLIGDREHRMREGLCHDISLKPNRGSRKVAIIDDADYFNQEGANCLLKTLEEPPPGAVIMLIGTSLQRQLPTIRSRSQVVRFEALSSDQCRDLLLKLQMADTPERAEELAALACGSLQRAEELLAVELVEFRQRFLERLAQPDWDPVALSKAVSNFVDEAGKEAAARRQRLRQLVQFAIELQRAVMLATAGRPSNHDRVLNACVDQALQQHPHESTLTRVIERSLETLQHVDSNANLATTIECWLDDLATLSRGESLPLFPES